MDYAKSVSRAVQLLWDKTRSCVRGLVPDLWTTYEIIKKSHQKHLPRMKKRAGFVHLTEEERMYAYMSHGAYRYVRKRKLMKVGNYRIVEELSDENSVVYSDEQHVGVATEVVISFRGTIATKYDDILTDMLLTFGREKSTERFAKAEAKYLLVRDRYPFVRLVTCGHSLGGSQAIFLARKYKIPCRAFNPAQGLALDYLDEVNKHPYIKVYRVGNDPVSCVAGLDNVSGIHLFPPVSDTNFLKNHTLKNFLDPPPVTK